MLIQFEDCEKPWTPSVITVKLVTSVAPITPVKPQTPATTVTAAVTVTAGAVGARWLKALGC